MAAESRRAPSPVAAQARVPLTRLPAADDRELVFSRGLAAPRALVWKAWTDPAWVAGWFCPADLTAAAYRVDARPGGEFRVAMRDPSAVAYPIHGHFLEVAAPERLVLALDTDQHPDDWKAQYNRVRGTPERREAFKVTFTVTLTARGEAETLLTVRMRYDTALDARANAEFGTMEGWALCLDKLEALARDPAATREIVLSRWLDAPVERVFRAYTDHDQLPRWWGPAGYTCETSEIDIRQGGRWRFTMHGPDGQDWPNLIEYLEVRAPERLRLRLSSGQAGDPGFDVVITFEARDGRTRLTQRTVFASAAACDEVKAFGATELGQTTLDKLEAFLAAR
jgi:uncharacterized protein YndB with AHSA1/START domain